VVMVYFWEVSGGYGGVAAENGEILSLFSSLGNCRASLVSLFLSVFFFLISLCLFLSSLSRGKYLHTNGRCRSR
jgi:hypothetical protein